MAVRDEAVTTGTDKQGDMRKRTAGQAPQANGAYLTQEAVEKSKEKVWIFAALAREGWMDGTNWMIEADNRSSLVTDYLVRRHLGRVRVLDCAARVHRAGFLHAHVEDWLVADRYLG